MKIAMTIGLAALLATTGAAMAEGPTVLSDAQLDRVTGGDREFTLLSNIMKVRHSGGEVSFGFSAPDRASQNDNFLGGFTFDSVDGAYVKTVPEGGFFRVAP